MIDACVIEGLERGIQIMTEKGIQHVTGELFEGESDGTVHSACAIGALALGLGIDPVRYRYWEDLDEGEGGDMVQYEVVQFYDTEDIDTPLYGLCPALKQKVDDGTNLFQWIFNRNDGNIRPKGKPEKPTLPELLEELKAMELE